MRNNPGIPLQFAVELIGRPARIADEESDLRRLQYPDLNQFPDLFKWILNILLYINSSEADLRKGWFHEKTAATAKKAKGPKKAKIKNMLKATSAEVTWVGRTLKVGYEPTGAGHARGDRKAPRLHKVRGFFRRQVCGAGRQERRLKWIRPFLRGAGKEALTPIYKVKE